MWEAFLLQMNEFDRFLEIELQHMLDPVVAVQPPARGGPKRARKLFLSIVAPTGRSGTTPQSASPYATLPIADTLS